MRAHTDNTPAPHRRAAAHDPSHTKSKAAAHDHAHPDKQDTTHTQSSAGLLQPLQARALPASPVIQRKPEKTLVTGITHLVKAKGNSIFLGDEVAEVSQGDEVEIEPGQKLRSRRGPNQETYREDDARGEHNYRWFKVVSLNGRAVGDNVYIRDETFHIAERSLLGSRPAAISGEHRERGLHLEDVIDPRGVEATGTPDLGLAWQRAMDPARYGYFAAKSGFDTLWTSCGQATESLLKRLDSLGARRLKLGSFEFKGAAGASPLAKLIKLPVRATTLLVLRDPSVHEFTIEKHPDGRAWLHQAYISNFSALWWAGLDLEEPQLDHLVAARVTENRNAIGNRNVINIIAFANAMRHYMEQDNYGEAALAAWNRLPFVPNESNIRTLQGKVQFTVEAFQLAGESEVRAALHDIHAQYPFFELVLREAREIKAKILAEKGKGAKQAVNPMLGALSGFKFKKSGGDDT